MPTLPDAIEQLSINYAVAGSPSIPIKKHQLNFDTEIAGDDFELTTDNKPVKRRLDSTFRTRLMTRPAATTTPATVLWSTTWRQKLSVPPPWCRTWSVGELTSRSSELGHRRAYARRCGSTHSAHPSDSMRSRDTLSFSLPAQNRGVLTSPATTMEINTPDANVPSAASTYPTYVRKSEPSSIGRSQLHDDWICFDDVYCGPRPKRDG